MFHLANLTILTMLLSAIENGDKGKIERCEKSIAGNETVRCDFKEELENADPETRKIIFSETNIKEEEYV